MYLLSVFHGWRHSLCYLHLYTFTSLKRVWVRQMALTVTWARDIHSYIRYVSSNYQHILYILLLYYNILLFKLISFLNAIHFMVLGLSLCKKLSCLNFLVNSQCDILFIKVNMRSERNAYSDAYNMRNPTNSQTIDNQKDVV